MAFFDVEHVAFQIMGHPVSCIELIGTIFGLASVYLASRNNILTWPTGIVNEIFLLLLFFQIRLFADVFLQVYFLLVTFYGWYIWGLRPEQKPISLLNKSHRFIILLFLLSTTALSGFLFQNIHLYLPELFKSQASYPFADSFIMVSAMLASILMAKRKIENWFLWICGDLVAIVVYFNKDIYFLCLEYVIFTGISAYGFFNWQKQMKHG